VKIFSWPDYIENLPEPNWDKKPAFQAIGGWLQQDFEERDWSQEDIDINRDRLIYSRNEEVKRLVVSNRFLYGLIILFCIVQFFFILLNLRSEVVSSLVVPLTVFAAACGHGISTNTKKREKIVQGNDEYSKALKRLSDYEQRFDRRTP